MDTSDTEIRAIRAEDAAEIEFVAQGMRKTLIEVEGEVAGTRLYSLAWLQQRVRWHLDPDQSDGAVFVANKNDLLVGHVIVRVEPDDEGDDLGLISTVYVSDEFRRDGIGELLLKESEQWTRSKNLGQIATWTSAANTKLIQLLERRSYQPRNRGRHQTTLTEMVQFARRLDP